MQIKAAIRGLLRKSIPNSIRLELKDHSLSGTPEVIMGDVCSTFPGVNNSVHRRLKMKGQNIKFTLAMNLKHYMTKYKALRLQILKTAY